MAYTLLGYARMVERSEVMPMTFDSSEVTTRRPPGRFAVQVAV